MKETFVEKTNFIISLSGVKPKNGEEMAISRVGKDLYKMLIKALKTYLSEILIQLYFSPTPRSSGQSILHSLMLRCSPGYPTERTMMIGMQIGIVVRDINCVLF